MTLSRVRILIAGIAFLSSVTVGAHSVWLFRQIGPPPGPVTTSFGPGYAQWQRERRVETNVGMRDAFALDYINRVGIPMSMGLALAALVLTVPGWPTRRMDRSLAVVSGVWLLVVFVLSFPLGREYQTGELGPGSETFEEDHAC